jgi:5-methylthioribose kinase
MSAKKYEPLTIETLADRLGSVDAICKIVGDDTSRWKIDEVGDGT